MNAIGKCHARILILKFTSVRFRLPMGDIVRFRRASPADKNKGKTLCANGFHKWRVATERRFDVKRGKLVTLRKCGRCGAEETRLT